MNRSNIFTVSEVLAKFDRPLWAEQLCIKSSYAMNDHAPYYWVGDGQYKRVTSKMQRWELGHYGAPDLEIVAQFEIPKFKLPFFEELRLATMLEF